MISSSPLDRILGILGTEDKFEAQTRLSEKFSEEIVYKAVTQWSQLVAWSWLEPADYPADRKPTDDEEALRNAFVAAIKATAMVFVRENYSPGEAIAEIKAKSSELADILSGQAPKKAKITLPKIYHKITSKDDYVFTDKLTDKFLWIASVERFTGVCAGYLPEDDQIVQILAYPPRPTPSTLTGKDLLDWSRKTDTDKNYIPPSPYIPTCNC